MIDYSGETAKYLPLMMNGFYLVRLGWIISNQKKADWNRLLLKIFHERYIEKYNEIENELTPQEIQESEQYILETEREIMQTVSEFEQKVQRYIQMILRDEEKYLENEKILYEIGELELIYYKKFGQHYGYSMFDKPSAEETFADLKDCIENNHIQRFKPIPEDGKDYWQD